MPPEQIPIGTFSRVTRLTPRALRLYDERGLLVPAGKDLCTGYRHYTFDQIGRGVRIGHLVSLGFSLGEVQTLLEAQLTGDRETIRSLFQARRDAVGTEIRRLAAIDAALSHNGVALEVFCMSITEPIIKEVPALRVLSRRGTGPYGETITRLIGEVCSVFKPQATIPQSARVAGPIMAIYHDSEYRGEDAEIEVALPIVGRIEIEEDGPELVTLPATRAVSVIYTGPYPGISAAHEAAFKHVQAHRLTPNGPARELYLNDPNEIEENGLMTEVQYPVV
ncbi:GyrI-like small molecule binding domain protein [anaerobic digester metagenome]